MSVLKLIGMLLIFASAITTAREYGEYCQRRIRQSSAFRAFVAHLESKAFTYLLPSSEAVCDFADEELAGVGFIDALREGGSLYSSFSLVKDKLLFSEGQKAALLSFFKDFGNSYVEDERARAKKAAQSLEELGMEDEKKTKESERVVKTLVLASALGLIILML